MANGSSVGPLRMPMCSGRCRLRPRGALESHLPEAYRGVCISRAVVQRVTQIEAAVTPALRTTPDRNCSRLLLAQSSCVAFHRSRRTVSAGGAWRSPEISCDIGAAPSTEGLWASLWQSLIAFSGGGSGWGPGTLWALESQGAAEPPTKACCLFCLQVHPKLPSTRLRSRACVSLVSGSSFRLFAYCLAPGQLGGVSLSSPMRRSFRGLAGPPRVFQLAPSVLMCRPLGLALGSFRGGGATAPFHRRRHLRSLQFLVCGASDRTLRHGQRHQDAGASLTWCMLPAESIIWARGAALWLGQVTASPRPVEVLLDHGPLLGLACP